MTIKNSGPLSLQEINTEFGLGSDLYSYRGVRWYRDDNTRGYFDGATGNNAPIDIQEFYGKRGANTVTFPVGRVTTYNAPGTYYFTVDFFYNNLLIEVRGGDGTAGGAGRYQYECALVWDGTKWVTVCANVWYNGADGTAGTASSFGTLAYGGGGAAGIGQTQGGSATGGGSGGYSALAINADINQTTLLKGVTVVCTVGSGAGAYVKITVQS